MKGCRWSTGHALQARSAPEPKVKPLSPGRAFMIALTLLTTSAELRGASCNPHLFRFQPQVHTSSMRDHYPSAVRLGWTMCGAASRVSLLLPCVLHACHCRGTLKHEAQLSFARSFYLRILFWRLHPEDSILTRILCLNVSSRSELSCPLD